MKQQLKKVLYILIGSIIGLLPLFLFYILGNTFLPFFAILIPLGGYTGLQFIEKNKNTKNIWMIMIISFLILCILVLLGIPFLTLFKDHFPLTLSNLFLYFEDNDFLIEVGRNFLFSFIFMIVGYGVIFLLLKDDDYRDDEDEKKI